MILTTLYLAGAKNTDMIGLGGPFLAMVAALAMAIELQEQLLAPEGELDSQQGALTTWVAGLAASERALGRARMECDGECD
jgi:hypothetical protein